MNELVTIPTRKSEVRYGYGEGADVLDLRGGAPYDPTNPTLGYLFGVLGNAGSRGTMLRSLATFISLLENDKPLCNLSEDESRDIRIRVLSYPWWDLTRPELDLVINRAITERSNGNHRTRGFYDRRTLQRMVTAIRGVFGECLVKTRPGTEQTWLDHAKYVQLTHRLARNQTKGANRKPPPGRLVELDEILLMLEVCDKDANRAKGIRDAAIVALSALTGPRASELVKLNLSEWKRRQGMLIIHQSKGGVSRKLPIVPGGIADTRLREWVDLRGEEPGPIFAHVNGYGQVRTRDRRDGDNRKRLRFLTRPDTVCEIVQIRGRQADLDKLVLHDLRRSLATRIARKYGVHLAARVLGHASIVTTDMYLRLDETELSEVAEAMDSELAEARELKQAA